MVAARILLRRADRDAPGHATQARRRRRHSRRGRGDSVKSLFRALGVRQLGLLFLKERWSRSSNAEQPGRGADSDEQQYQLQLSALTTASLSSGSKGELVTRVQQQLYSSGYFASRPPAWTRRLGSTGRSKLFQKASPERDGQCGHPSTVRDVPAAARCACQRTHGGGYVAAATPAEHRAISRATPDHSPRWLPARAPTAPGMSKAQKLEYVICVAQNRPGQPMSRRQRPVVRRYQHQVLLKRSGSISSAAALEYGARRNLHEDQQHQRPSRGDLVYLNTVAIGSVVTRGHLSRHGLLHPRIVRPAHPRWSSARWPQAVRRVFYLGRRRVFGEVDGEQLYPAFYVQILLQYLGASFHIFGRCATQKRR